MVSGADEVLGLDLHFTMSSKRLHSVPLKDIEKHVAQHERQGWCGNQREKASLGCCAVEIWFCLSDLCCPTNSENHEEKRKQGYKVLQRQ